MDYVPKILIVDDTLASQMAIESQLVGQGYQLYLADDGPAALALAHEILPDLILLDVMMPGMDGFAVCSQVRATPSLREIPVVMVTSLEDARARLLAIEAGADDLLYKPFDRTELRIRVRSITRLNRYRNLLDERQKVDQAVEEIQRQNLKLKALSHQMLKIQELERRAIAIELHDDLGQSLSALRLMIRQMEPDLPPHSLERYRRLYAVVDNMISQVRNIALGLRPSMLDDLGLYPALAWLAKQTAANLGIPVTCHFSEFRETRYPAAIETAIFRIAQEGLTNVTRHSHARQVDLRLSEIDDRLVFELADDGDGFDLATLTDSRHYSTGISGMQERARMASGSLEIDTSAHMGTRIWVSFQLSEPGES